MNIKDFFLKYGERKILNNGDFLFKNKDNDTNLYYIIKGKVLLLIGSNPIAIVSENQLLGEKSFLLDNGKPIDAKSETNLEILSLDQNTFSKINEEEKIDFLKKLTIFISDRVYLLNDIIDQISYLNKNISYIKVNLDINYFKLIFENIYNIENIAIFKKIEERYIPLFESSLNKNYYNIIENINQDNISDIIEYINDKLIIKSKNYIYILEGEYKKDKYITENVMIHSISTLEYLGELINEEKNKELETFLDY